MMPDPSNQVEAIFSQAVGLSPSARHAYLNVACEADPALRAEVESLLLAHDQAGDFLEPLAWVAGQRPEDGPGTRIGPYKLLQLIGEGGMGTVYKAEQEAPMRRYVALKILKLGMDTRRIIARFEAERQALAMMEHVNIARVLDAGATPMGRPYFVMELVRGVPITTYCDQHHLPLDARLALLCRVCRAVQHAHQKGIIHRDLKPANILVTVQDGAPIPKVIDFGVAKATHQRLTDKTIFTSDKQIIGTPQYMSPEQAAMSGLDVDTRSDVYSLGVVLYELLTSQTPFDIGTLRASTQSDFQQLIRDVEPPTPSTRLSTLGGEVHEVAQKRQTEPKLLHKRIRGDLDRVVMKALEKDRTRRYDTALELAQDVERHLRCEPVLAGAPTLADHVRKFYHRHRFGVLAGTVTAVALLMGTMLAMSGWYHAQTQAQLAREAEQRAQTQAARSQAISDYLQDMLTSVHPPPVSGVAHEIESVLTTARHVFGDDHATVAATMTSLAARLYGEGRLEAAESLVVESLRLWELNLGTANGNYLSALTLLGKVQAGQEQDRVAEGTFREVIRLSEPLTDKVLSPVADAHDGLARLVAARGDYDEAVELLREALRLQHELIPGQRFSRIERLDRLGRLLVDAGRREEAEGVWREHRELAQQLYPIGSLRLAELNVNFARFLGERGKTLEAVQRVREAISIYERRRVPPLEPLVFAQQFLYRLLASQPGGLKRAEELRHELEHNARQLWGERDLRLADMLFDFAQLAYQRSQPGVAIQQAIQAQKIYQAAGNGTLDTKSLVRLIRWSVLLANRGHYEDEVYSTAVQGAQLVVDSEPHEARAHMLLGIAQFRSGKFREARDTLLAADRQYSGPSGGSPTTLSFLAMSYYGMGDRVQAHRTLARAQILMDDPRWAGDTDDQGAVDEATLYLAQHNASHQSYICPSDT